MMEFQSEEILHMPDLLFARICEEKYEINKGVYNTIDSWFYKQGLCQIVERRKTILSFFQYIRLTENQVKKVKFGPGGLTIRLEHFWEQSVGRFNHKAI
jgi:riboflavin kinase